MSKGEWLEKELYVYITTRQETDIPFTPIQEFAIALLENAVTGLRGLAIPGSGGRASRAKARHKKREEQATEDRSWFNSNDDSPCQFVWCCQVLGVSPTYLRELVLPLYMTALDGYGTTKPT